MSAMTMCDRPEVTEAEFRTAHPGLLGQLAALDNDQIEWLLVYLRMPRWQRPVWRFRNWLMRPAVTRRRHLMEFALLQFLIVSPLLFMLGWAFWTAVQH